MGRSLVAVALVAVAALGHAASGRAASGWCGNDQLATDRPDVVGGRKVHVIYAIPADGLDRFRETAPLIVADLAAITEWWRREDPTRAPRWDVFPFPGCEPGLGSLDLTSVRLPRATDAYADSVERLARLTSDLGSTVADRAKKYLVYYDGLVPEEDLCGRATGQPAVGGPSSLGAVFMRARPRALSCGAFGIGGYGAKTAAHELLHSLGAVPSSAPNACPGDALHVCDDPLDVMRSGGPSLSFADYRLDVGRDDYYAHGGSWWDVQDSLWLATDAPDSLLTVDLVGAGPESVVKSELPGIDCPRVCSLTWAGGDKVALTADPGVRRRFVRWGGDCSGDYLSCRLSIDTERTVRAVFGPDVYRLVVQVRGRGKVVSAYVRACRGRCSADVPAGATVVLRAVADRGWRLARWAGCTRRVSSCRLTITRNALVRAIFVRRQAR